MEVIQKSEASHPEMVKTITECLKDDKKEEPAQERAYAIQKCVLEKGGME